MINKIALWDLDGSLADYVGQLIKDLNAMRGPGDPLVTAENIWDLDKYPYIKARMDAIKRIRGWWRNLPVIESGMRVFREAERIGFHNIVLTKAPKKISDAWSEKYEWSMANLDSEIEAQVINSNKGLVYGRVLFDDSVEFALDWLVHHKRGTVIMPDTPYNKTAIHPQILRWTGENWDEVVKALVFQYEREEVHSH